MPNWCLNEVRVHFPDKQTRDSFLKAVEGGRKASMMVGDEKIEQMEHTTMLFNKILPRPEEEDENWYEWNIENWGTKWEPDIIHFDREDDTTVYWEMYTAWAPPEGIYNKLVDDWKDEDVHICWFFREDGMQFAGFLPDY